MASNKANLIQLENNLRDANTNIQIQRDNARAAERKELYTNIINDVKNIGMGVYSIAEQKATANVNQYYTDVAQGKLNEFYSEAQNDTDYDNMEENFRKKANAFIDESTASMSKMERSIIAKNKDKWINNYTGNIADNKANWADKALSNFLNGKVATSCENALDTDGNKENLSGMRETMPANLIQVYNEQSPNYTDTNPNTFEYRKFNEISGQFSSLLNSDNPLSAVELLQSNYSDFNDYKNERLEQYKQAREDARIAGNKETPKPINDLDIASEFLANKASEVASQVAQYAADIIKDELFTSAFIQNGGDSISAKTYVENSIEALGTDLHKSLFLGGINNQSLINSDIPIYQRVPQIEAGSINPFTGDIYDTNDVKAYEALRQNLIYQQSEERSTNVVRFVNENDTLKSLVLDSDALTQESADLFKKELHDNGYTVEDLVYAFNTGKTNVDYNSMLQNATNPYNGFAVRTNVSYLNAMISELGVDSNGNIAITTKKRWDNLLLQNRAYISEEDYNALTGLDPVNFIKTVTGDSGFATWNNDFIKNKNLNENDKTSYMLYAVREFMNKTDSDTIQDVENRISSNFYTWYSAKPVDALKESNDFDPSKVYIKNKSTNTTIVSKEFANYLNELGNKALAGEYDSFGVLETVDNILSTKSDSLTALMNKFPYKNLNDEEAVTRACTLEVLGYEGVMLPAEISIDDDNFWEEIMSIKNMDDENVFGHYSREIGAYKAVVSGITDDIASRVGIVTNVNGSVIETDKGLSYYKLNDKYYAKSIGNHNDIDITDIILGDKNKPKDIEYELFSKKIDNTLPRYIEKNARYINRGIDNHILESEDYKLAKLGHYNGGDGPDAESATEVIKWINEYNINVGKKKQTARTNSVTGITFTERNSVLGGGIRVATDKDALLVGSKSEENINRNKELYLSGYTGVVPKITSWYNGFGVKDGITFVPITEFFTQDEQAHLNSQMKK